MISFGCVDSYAKIFLILYLHNPYCHTVHVALSKRNINLIGKVVNTKQAQRYYCSDVDNVGLLLVAI